MTKLNLSDKRLSRIWKECGCPTSGIISTIKKNTKSRYKYEVCRLKRQANHIKSVKLAGAWCNSRSNDFWNLVRQSRGNSKLSGCNIIDGLTTDNDISNMFSSKISLLLNSDLDQSARNSFLADLTDSNSNSDLLTSAISSTVVLNTLESSKIDMHSLPWPRWPHPWMKHSYCWGTLHWLTHSAILGNIFQTLVQTQPPHITPRNCFHSSNALVVSMKLHQHLIL